jgi:hypothetical protein
VVLVSVTVVVCAGRDVLLACNYCKNLAHLVVPSISSMLFSLLLVLST